MHGYFLLLSQYLQLPLNSACYQLVKKERVIECDCLLVFVLFVIIQVCMRMRTRGTTRVSNLFYMYTVNINIRIIHAKMVKCYCVIRECLCLGHSNLIYSFPCISRPLPFLQPHDFIHYFIIGIAMRPNAL